MLQLGVRSLLYVLLAWMSGLGSTSAVAQAGESCPSTPADLSQGWQPIVAGKTEFLLPPGYVRAEARSVDWAVRAWSAAEGRRVDTDLGFWTNHFLGRRDGPVERLIAICNSAADGEWPQIVLFQDRAGRYAAGLYWPLPNGRMLAEDEGRVRAEALWMVASSPDSADLVQLLGIVRSVRLQ